MVAPLVAMAASEAAKDPKVQAAIGEMMNQPDKPLYIKRWINEDGLLEELAITPRMVLMVGGGVALAAIAYFIYKFTEENHVSFMGGMPNFMSLFSGFGSSGMTAGALANMKEVAGGVHGEVVDQAKKAQDITNTVKKWLGGLF